MASVFDLLPCSSPSKMVTSVIQTRIFTATGPLPIDCDSVTSLSDPSSCNVWANALSDLSVIPCSGSTPVDPPPPVDPPVDPLSEPVTYHQPIGLDLGFLNQNQTVDFTTVIGYMGIIKLQMPANANHIDITFTPSGAGVVNLILRYGSMPRYYEDDYTYAFSTGLTPATIPNFYEPFYGPISGVWYLGVSGERAANGVRETGLQVPGTLRWSVLDYG